MTSSSFESRLGERARQAGLTLPPDFAVPAERFYELLAKWNATTNLTALPLEGYPADSVDRLFLEPLLAATLIPDDSALFCVDVGSGAGSPAIPFALARPRVRLVMVESVGKKVAFLREALRVVGLTQAAVKQGRFEDVAPAFPNAADVILIRGVKITAGLSEALQISLKHDGKLFAFGASHEIEAFGWQLVEQRRFSDSNGLAVFVAIR